MASFSPSYGSYTKKVTSPLIEKIAQSESGFTLPKSTTKTTTFNNSNDANKYAIKNGVANGTIATPSSVTKTALTTGASTPALKANAAALTSALTALGASPAVTLTNVEEPASNANAGSDNSNNSDTIPTANNSNGISNMYQSYYDSILADQKAAMEARQKALEENYNRQLGVLQNAHNENVNNLDSQRDDALRSAYISYMLGQKGLNQQLSNQGMNGGSVESTLAKLLNNYGGNRGSIENQYAQALGSLNSSYDSNVANLANTYGNNIADVLADYYNNAASAKQNYVNQLMSLAKANSTASTKSSNTTDSKVSNYAKVYGNLINNGYATDAKNYLDSLNVDDATRNAIVWASGNSASLANGEKLLYTPEVRQQAIDNMRSLMASDDDNAIQNYINNLQTTYGVNDAEIAYLLNGETATGSRY